MATLTETVNNAFTNGPFYYTLGETPPTEIIYNLNTLFSSTIQADCGDPMLKFINDDDPDYTDPDVEVFSEDRTNPGSSKFIIGGVGGNPLENIDKADTYNLKFEFWYSDAP